MKHTVVNVIRETKVIVLCCHEWMIGNMYKCVLVSHGIIFYNKHTFTFLCRNLRIDGECTLIVMPCNSLRLMFLVVEMKMFKKIFTPFPKMLKRRLGLLQFTYI